LKAGLSGRQTGLSTKKIFTGVPPGVSFSGIFFSGFMYKCSAGLKKTLGNKWPQAAADLNILELGNGKNHENV